MVTVDIITNDMHQLHGANKVTEKLILGRDIFLKNGIDLRYVVSQDGIIECANYEEGRLGADLGTNKYKTKRKIIELLKKFPIYNTSYLQKKIVQKQFKSNSSVVDFVKTIETKPDFIIYQDPFTAIYYLEKTNDKTPSLFISHADTDPLEQFFLGRPSLRGGKFEKKLRDNFQFLFSRVKTVVTICSSSQKYMMETYGLECPCILNGIEDCGYQHVYDSTKEIIDICIVGSVNYRKGQDLAVDAFATLSNEEKKKIRLHIVGGGSELSNIINQVKQLGLEEYVIIHGPVINIAKLLSTMDVFMLPSRADTVPIAIIEAMRAGLPIFATDVGEISRMIDGCGVVISNGIDEIALVYRDLLGKVYNISQMGINARAKFLSEYNVSEMADNYSLVIKRLYHE